MMDYEQYANQFVTLTLEERDVFQKALETANKMEEEFWAPLEPGQNFGIDYWMKPEAK